MLRDIERNLFELLSILTEDFQFCLHSWTQSSTSALFQAAGSYRDLAFRQSVITIHLPKKPEGVDRGPAWSSRPVLKEG